MILEYLSIYQTLRSDLKASLEVCHTTGREFVSTLSNKIRTMRISFDLLGDILEAIAKSNTRPAILEFKTNDWYYPWLLGDPQQIPYIKEITSLKTLKLGLKLPAQVYSQSFSPNRITKLSIHLYNDPFYIDWLFSMFPLLEELYIICGHRLTVRIDENSSFAQGDLVKHFPNLLKLVVKCGKIDQKCFDFFKTTSPNITHLNLEAFFLPNSPNEHFTIDISGWDLKLCTILLFKKFAQEKHILYKTMVSTLSPKAFNDTEGYKYICGVLNKASSYKLFNLVCRNRQSLVINGHSLTALDDTVAVYKL
jgi:hypothetical protein